VHPIKIPKVSKNQEKVIQGEIKKMGAFLQEQRKAKGYTQEAFSEALEVNVNTIKYIEQGRRSPSLEMLLKICGQLELELNLIEH